jgi:hypothetical protein
LLNRRLTQNIYLGVAKITLEKGRIAIDEKGPAVEYAVRMREMPQERMMDRLLSEGRVTEKDIRAIVQKLVPFYRSAKTGQGINPFGRIEVIAKNTEENFLQTEPFVGRLIPKRMVDRMVSGVRDFLRENQELFTRRIQEGRIRDCHGDLHPGNICLDKDIEIYDCIEFNHRFRYSDICGDLAFLAMDLDFYGAPELSALLIKEVVRASGDRELPRLLPFYKAYRAHVRAKVHSLASDENEISAREKKDHARLAERYYHLAYHYIQKEQRPRLFVVFGLMGTGKTSLARALAQKTRWPVISSDETRKALAGIPPTARKWASFGKDLYSKTMSRKTYQTMKVQAGKRLRQGQSVIMDGSYKRQSERLALVALAEKTGARIRFLECRAPIKIIRQRLERRRQDPKAVSDGRWQIFDQQRRDFDPVIDPVRTKTLLLQTTVPIQPLVQKILRNG